MEGNTTEQDDLLAKITGLTSGVGIKPEAPQAPSAPAAPQAPVPPVPPVAPVQEAPVPPVAPTPVVNETAGQPSFNLPPMPDNNLNVNNDMNMNNGMPGMNPMPQPAPYPSAPVAPEMPTPGGLDPFAQSLGATVVANEEPQPEATQNAAPEIPSMNGSRIPVPDNKIPTFTNVKSKKKSNGAFVFIIVFLVLAIIGAGAYACYSNGLLDSLINKFTGSKPVSTIPDDTQVTDPLQNNDSFITTPVVETKFVDKTVTVSATDKVIKADYVMEGLEYDAAYIKMPYINMGSEDAKAINEELINKFKDYANISADYMEANKAAVNNADFKQKYLIVYYQAITQGDVISVLMNELNYDGTDALWNHYTYTLSASTGKKLSLTDLQTILKVDNTTMNNAYETYITSLIASSTAADKKATFEHKINAFKTLAEYYSNINDKQGIYYYVDGMGRINIITKVYIGDKNIFRVVSYQPGVGCQVKDFKINDAKQMVGFTQMTPSANNVNSDTEAVDTTASSNLQVKASSLTSLSNGDLIYGEDLKKIYRAYEYLLGQKGESLTFRVLKDGTKSYSKGQYDELDKDVSDDNIYRLEIIKYSSGSYRIITASDTKVR